MRTSTTLKKGDQIAIKHPQPRANDCYGSWLILTNHVDGTCACHCVCGVEKKVSTWDLVKGRSNSCGCRARGKQPLTPAVNSIFNLASLAAEVARLNSPDKWAE